MQWIWANGEYKAKKLGAGPKMKLLRISRRVRIGSFQVDGKCLSHLRIKGTAKITYLLVFAISRSGDSAPRGRPTVPPVISRIVSSLMVIRVVSSWRWHTIVSLRGRWRSGRVSIPRSLMIISRAPVGVHTRGMSIISGRGSRRRRHWSRRYPRRQWRRVVVTTPNGAIWVRLPRSVRRIVVTRSTRSRSKVFSLPLNRWSRGIPGDRYRTRTPGSDPR